MSTHATSRYLPRRPALGVGAIGLKHLLFGLFLVLSLRTFQYFPGMPAMDTVWLVVLFLYGVAIYIPSSRMHFSRLELYALAVMLIVPLYSTLMAHLVFGQPLVYGVLAQRTAFFGFGALAVMRMLRTGKLSLLDVEKTLVALGWCTMVLYLAIHFLLNPASFAGYPGFVGGGNIQPFQFKFHDAFIVFACLYYALKGFRQGKLSCYVAAAVFFVYLVLVQGGRSELLSVIAVFGFCILRWGGLAKSLTYLPKVIIGAGILALVLVVCAPAYMSDLVDRTQDAISVVTQDKTGEDVSANARVMEKALAQPYINRHWLFGNGAISNQWKEGYSNILSDYFYPSDIGIYGVVFVYGVAGLLLYAGQFGFAWRASRRLRRDKVHTALGDALAGYILYVAIHSLVTGEYVWHWQITLTMLVVLYWLGRPTGSSAGGDLKQVGWL